MKAISLWQPWATAMALGIKKIETRSWSSWYTGDIAIHAAMKFTREARHFAEIECALGRLPNRLPFGVLLCVVNLKECDYAEDIVQNISAIERLYGDYSPGRFAWITDNLRVFKEPIPYRGMQGIFEIPDSIIKEAL